MYLYLSLLSPNIGRSNYLKSLNSNYRLFTYITEEERHWETNNENALLKKIIPGRTLCISSKFLTLYSVSENKHTHVLYLLCSL
jgi:hypothetical protein